MKLFIDTNIFLDIALDRKDAKDGLILFKAVKNGLFEGVVADITIVNIAYISKRFDSDIKKYLQAIEQSFCITGADNQIIKEALELDNNDLEDSVQYLLALKNGCECVVSNDKSFYRGKLETLNSREFVELYLNEVPK